MAVRTVARTFLVVILGLVGGLPATANASDIFDEGGFYFPSKLPERPRNFLRVQQATPRFNLSGERCSAVLVSNTGYAVTAAHCIHQFLKKKWNYDPIVRMELTEKTKFYKVRLITNRTSEVYWPDFVKRELRLDNYIWSGDPGELSPIRFDYIHENARIAWIGKGSQNHTETSVPQYTPAEVDFVAENNDDVVVLKYDLPASQNSACLPIARSAARPGDKVWTIGHPARVNRENGLGSRGNSLYVSPGRVRGSVTQDPIYQSYVEGMRADDRELFWAREKAIWDRSSILQSSADIYGGNSGGAMVNAGGELVAIAFTVSNTAEEKYVGATSFGYRADHLRSLVAKDLGTAKANEIFSCR